MSDNPTKRIKFNPQIAELDVDDDVLDSTLDEFAKAATEQIDAEAYLGFLHRQGVIGTDEYISAISRRPLSPEGSDSTEPTNEKDRYHLMDSIGSGGMAEIRLARDAMLDRNVAVKILHDDRRGSGPTLRRFLQEARITGNLDHPNIVPVHGLNIEEEGDVSFTMKLVNGRTLEHLLNDVGECLAAGEELPEEDTLRGRLDAFTRICDAVEYAHRKGVIHRDLKPANIMIGHLGEVYVMDWGIAKIVGDAGDFELDTVLRSSLKVERDFMLEETADGTVIGTPRYMSKEQALGRTVDATSDVVALGAVLHELVTLQKQVSGGDRAEILMNVIQGRRHAAEVQPDGTPVPGDLAAIIARATALDPAARYQSVHALAQDVRRFLADEETHARPDSAFRRLLRWVGRNRQLSVLVFFLVSAVLGATAAVSLYQENRAMAQARAREAMTNELVTSTAQRAHAIDSQFLRLAASARSIARAASNALAGRYTSHTAVYRAADFDSEPPPATSYESKLYNKRIALDRPAYKIPPGANSEEFADRLTSLGAVGPAFHSAFRDAAGVGPEEKLTAFIESGRSPIRWAYVGTEDGIMLSYPAKGGYAPEYDPRERPWYALGEGKREVSWGNAYLDVQGQGMVLPGVVGVQRRDGSFSGVAGIEATFDWIIDAYMQPEAPVTETYLLDADAGVVMRSSDFGADREKGLERDPENLPKYPHADVVARLDAAESGVATVGGKRGTLVSYQRIPSLGWYYVEEVPADALPR